MNTLFAVVSMDSTLNDKESHYDLDLEHERKLTSSSSITRDNSSRILEDDVNKESSQESDSSTDIKSNYLAKALESDQRLLLSE